MTRAARTRNHGLDLARALAIALVVAAHGKVLVPWFPLRDALGDAGGYFGVELFFVLSGYLIGGILLRGLPAGERVTTFWARRWFRTVPAYALFLLVNVAMSPLVLGGYYVDATYFLFVQNLAWPMPPLMPESWSLTIEEWSYLLLPLTLLAALRLPLGARAASLVGALTYVGLFTAARVVFVEQAGPDAPWNDGVRRVALVRLDAIGYGVLVAWAARFHGPALARAARPCALFGAALTAASLVLYLELTGAPGAFARVWLFSLTSAGLALLLPWLSARPAPGGPRERLVRRVSLTSYSAYLCHNAVALPLTQLLAPDLPWPVAVVLYLTLTGAIAAAAFAWFERPTTRLRERFAPERVAALPAPPAPPRDPVGA